MVSDWTTFRGWHIERKRGTDRETNRGRERERESE